MSNSVVDDITKTILDFSWDDYGLDEVSESDPEYASFLANEIAGNLLVLLSKRKDES